MQFDDKKNAIKHIESLCGELFTKRDTGQEVVYYLPSKETIYKYELGMIDKDSLVWVEAYKIKFDVLSKGAYWITYMYANGSWVKLNG